MPYFPQGSSEMNGLRHVILTGFRAGQPVDEEDLLYDLVHLDAGGRPDSWLFDTAVVIGQPSSGNAIGADVNRGTTMSGEGDFYAIPVPNPSNRRDWEEIVEALFRPGGWLAVREGLIAGLSDALGPPPSPMNVIIGLPYPAITQSMFGKLPGGTRNLNFSVLGQNLTRATADRLEAEVWMVEQIHGAWKKANLRHQRLLGFYWVFETVYRGWDVDDHYLLKELRRYVSGLGLKMFWIPFWSSYNVHLLDNYRDYYFDLAFLQPNYMFYKTLTGVGLRPAAEAARQRHAGIEIEYYLKLDEPVAIESERHQRFREYLDGGVEFGYMTEAACAYFIGGGGVRALFRSPDPRERAFYEDIYRFVKGTYRRR
ncbi:MAG: DUF4855 domain-containing protein [Bacillota bacterium]